MEIKSLFSDDKFSIFLAHNIKNTDQLKAYSSLENVTLLNPELILGYNHIAIALEKAVISKRRKQNKPLNKDIIYYTLENKSVEYCIPKHAINFNKEVNAFIIFINTKTTSIPSKEELQKKLDCSVLDIVDYSKFINFELIKEEFAISDCEINNDSGIIGAVYNRLSLKDLK